MRWPPNTRSARCRRVRALRLARAARSDGAVAAAIRDWEMRLASLTEGVAPVTPPPRVWTGIVSRLGLADAPVAGASVPWWARLAFWRSFALASFAVAMAFGVTLFTPAPKVPEQPIVAVLAGPDAKPALIATAMRGERTMTIKVVGAAPVPAGKSLELWMLPDGSPPKSLGVIPDSGVGRVALPAAPDVRWPTSRRSRSAWSPRADRPPARPPARSSTQARSSASTEPSVAWRFARGRL